MELFDKLTQLNNDIKDKLSIANGYNTDLVDVKHGEVLYPEVTQVPIVCFVVNEDTTDPDYMDDTQRRVANLIIYGYIQSTEDHKPLFDLVQDVINFLNDRDDWTYTDDTIFGSVTYRYGNKLNLDKDLFFMTIQLQYSI
jgi:hypothetical protein